MLRVDLYVDDKGQPVVADFIRGLPARDKAKVVQTIRLLEEFGINLRRPHADHLGDGLWELICGKHARLIYFHVRTKLFLVLHGFWKTKQKTPPSEIATARRRRAQFLDREEKEGHGADTT